MAKIVTILSGPAFSKEDLSKGLIYLYVGLNTFPKRTCTLWLYFEIDENNRRKSVLRKEFYRFLLPGPRTQKVAQGYCTHFTHSHSMGKVLLLQRSPLDL